MTTHLRKREFGAEYEGWCGARSYRDEDMQEDPRDADCVPCLDAACDFGARANLIAQRIRNRIRHAAETHLAKGEPR